MPQSTKPLDLVLNALKERGANAEGSVSEFLAQHLAEQGMSRADVIAMQHDAIARFAETREAGRFSDEDMALMSQLADVSEAASVEVGRQDSAISERDTALDDLAGRMQPLPDPAADPATDTGAPAGDPAPTDAAPATPAAPAAAPAADAPAAPALPEPVAASVAAAAVRRMQDQAPQPTDTPRPRGNIVKAASGVRGVDGGQELPDIAALTAAAVSKFESLPPNGTLPEGSLQAGHIAQVIAQYPAELVASGANDTDVVEFAADQSRLEQGSLVASGGWGAPSEVFYDMSPSLASATAGLVDMPSIGVTRGGIRTAPSPVYADLVGQDIALTQTEVQAQANTLKRFYRVPQAGAWNETRADVVYTGIESGILQDDALPEQKRAHMEIALALHAHEVNRMTIAKAVAKALGVSAAALGPSAVNAALNAVEWLIENARYAYRTDPSMMFDVWLPLWARVVLRADYALRNGIPLENVTDEQITAWFTVRGARVQWLYDWQDHYSGVTGGVGAPFPSDGSGTLTYPTSLLIEIHPANTFVRGRGQIVNIEGVYDSTNLETNDCLALFMEEKLLVHQRAYKAWKVTVPINVMGAAGSARLLDHNGKIATT
ncbi:major capsid protein [Williamsia herbipolensis]|uniref:Major capsid protein n=1 Tax=Williamsia herbipolensis TaxID=1603258 RepID=A0AAU4K032_9NOCA|nr:major capsid protein [Williamsia herbipolensis]